MNKLMMYGSCLLTLVACGTPQESTHLKEDKNEATKSQAENHFLGYKSVSATFDDNYTFEFDFTARSNDEKSIGKLTAKDPTGKLETGLLFKDLDAEIRRPDATAIYALDDKKDRMNFTFIVPIGEGKLKIDGSHQGNPFSLKVVKSVKIGEKEVEKMEPENVAVSGSFNLEGRISNLKGKQTIDDYVYDAECTLKSPLDVKKGDDFKVVFKEVKGSRSGESMYLLHKDVQIEVTCVDNTYDGASINAYNKKAKKKFIKAAFASVMN